MDLYGCCVPHLLFVIVLDFIGCYLVRLGLGCRGNFGLRCVSDSVICFVFCLGFGFGGTYN